MNRMFYVFIIVLIISITTGCKPRSSYILSEREIRRETKSRIYDIVCVDGHEYYAGYYSLAIRLTSEGKPIKCNSDTKLK